MLCLFPHSSFVLSPCHWVAVEVDLSGEGCVSLCHGFLSRLHCSASSHGLRIEFRGKQEDLAVQARVEPVLGDDAVDVTLQCMRSTVVFWKLWVKLIDSLVDFWCPFYH